MIDDARAVQSIWRWSMTGRQTMRSPSLTVVGLSLVHGNDDQIKEMRSIAIVRFYWTKDTHAPTATVDRLEKTNAFCRIG